MKKFNKYILRIYFSNLFSVSSIILILYTFFQIIQHTRYISKYGAKLTDIIIFDMMKIPYSLYQIFPIAGATAVVLLILRLLKNSELIAYLSLGGKIQNIAKMIVFINLIFVLASIYYSNTINPKIEGIRYKFKYEKLLKEPYYKKVSLTDFYLKEGNKIYGIDLIDFNKKTLYGIKILTLANGKIKKINSFEKCKFLKSGSWECDNYVSVNTEGIVKKTAEKKKIILKENTFTEIIKIPAKRKKKMNFHELLKVIKIYEAKGLNADSYKLLLYNKIAMPVILIVLTIFLIPISIDISRNYQYIKIASKSLGFSILFWIVYSISFSLGKNGVLSPFVANFSAHILFSFVGILMILKKEKGL